MGDELVIAFFIAVPVVLLAASFVYCLQRRRQDIDKISQSNTPARQEDEYRPGRSQHTDPSPSAEADQDRCE